MKNLSIMDRTVTLGFKTLILTCVLLGLSSPESQAQMVYFGKNRVQYEDFDWRYIQTDHFDIYYYDAKNYHLAQFTAESVESGLMQLSEDFDHQITDRISVIIYDSHADFSQTNVVPLPIDAQGIGGVTDKYKNRMTQPFMGDYIDFRRTLQHELVHAFINDMYYGGSLQSIVQNNIQLVFPIWFEEGLAEYLALGWDTNTDMYMREAVLNNFLPDLQQLYGYYAYRGGQSFWYFIEETYGRPKITEILQRVKATRSIERSLALSLGLNLEELSDRWQDHLKRRYYPEVAQREPIKNIATQITKRKGFGSYNTSPAISPQGDELAFISNRRGLFDVILVDSRNGKRLKTLVKGEDNPMFEELNILNPNLSWAPDGSAILLSTKSQGRYSLAIVDVETGDIRQLQFPGLDGIQSVDWSPDARKIAFDGNQGPYQDIFIYDLETGEFTNLTRDVYSDREPAWGGDSKTLYFVSDRADQLEPGTYLSGFSILSDYSVYTTDLYRIDLTDGRMERLTSTPKVSEFQPTLSSGNDLYYLSDENGIQNIWHYDLETYVSNPVTDVQSGIMQISVSDDGSRLALNSLNEGYLDVFLMRNPESRIRQEPLVANEWAKRRDAQEPDERVKALRYAKELIQARPNGNAVLYDQVRGLLDQKAEAEIQRRRADLVRQEESSEPDTAGVNRIPFAQIADTTKTTDRIDFRNYVFAPEVAQDTTLGLRDDPRKFDPDDHLTEGGYYQPRKYRLAFSPDFTYAAGGVDTYYGTAAFATFTFSDLFGDHQIGISTNLVFDLRNSTYVIQYGYLKQRTNYYASFFHQAQNYQTFSGELLRFRTYGLGVNAQYPLNKFQRIDYGATFIGIARDFSSISGISSSSTFSSEQSRFLYPEVSFVGDYSVQGFITPTSGSRYSLRLSGSPPLSENEPQFISLMGDYRRYINLTSGYSIALRSAGAASFGRDSQTYFMGGVLGWINQRWSNVDIPFERLADTFFTQPATPVRGHRYNTVYGDKYGLINAEFRFPLFAAVLPGPVPILPLYNITGVAFLDAGAAWGFDIDYYTFVDQNGNPIYYARNSANLDFRVGEEKIVYLNPETGLIREGTQLAGDVEARYFDGDLLIGGGFGLRSIFLGLPFRYDIAWPYVKGGFKSEPIHYFSIGIDF